MRKVLRTSLIFLLGTTMLTGCYARGKAVPEDHAISTAETKPVVFKAFHADTNPNADNFSSPVAKAIQKKTGVTLEIEYNTAGDEKQKISLMTASGDYPDLVFAKGNLSILKDAGIILRLDELIEELGPNIRKVYGDSIKRLKWSKEDPYIYQLPYSPVQNQLLEPVNGFQLQHAVVKELGFPKLKTLKDYERAIKAYYEKHPTIDGEKTIPLTLNGFDWRFLISVTNPACLATGGPDDGEWYIDQSTLQAVRHHTRPEEREYFRWLNHMNDIGLLDSESFVQKYGGYKAKIASGRVLAVIDASWSLSESMTELRKAGKEDRMFGFYPITLNENYKYAEFMDSEYVAGWGAAITKKCKDVPRLMKFIDWMSTEEAQILVNWGIEGEHYRYDNGKRVLMPKYSEMRKLDPAFTRKTGIGNYCTLFPRYGNTVKDYTGNYFSIDNEEEILARQTRTENEVLAAYGARMWKDLYPKKSEFPLRPYGAAFLINGMDDSELKAIDTKIVQIGYKRLVEAILCKPSEFDTVYDVYLREINEAGLSVLTKAFNKNLLDALETWK